MGDESENTSLIVPTIRRRSVELPRDTIESLFPEESSRKDVLVFGLNLSSFLSTRAVAAVLCISTILASVAFAELQEKVFHIPGFTHSGWMTIITLVTYVGCAALEMGLAKTRRVGSMRDYLVLSVFTMLGTYFTNWSLQYLSYSLRVMFKSAKVIPVMIISALYVGRRYGWQQYIGAVSLSLGIMLFSFGDSSGSGTGHSVDLRGIVLIMGGIFADAMASNFEEKRFFCRSVDSSSAEVVLYSSLLGLVWSLIAEILSGSLGPALVHTRQHPEVIYYCIAFSFLGYVAASLIMLTIKHFGATVAEFVKSFRKLITVILSFYVFGKPWRPLHILGTGFFAMSVFLEFVHRAFPRKRRKSSHYALEKMQYTV